MPRTLEIGRQAVEAHPENTLIRANLALYAMYAGDFETAAQEAEIVLESNPSYETAYVPAAMALIDQADFAGAGEVYDRLRQVSPWGASLAATGAADLALFQSQLANASNLLEHGIASDQATELDAEAARKLMMLARVRSMRGDEAGAVAATEEGLSLCRRRNIDFAAAGLLIETGRTERALELSQALASQFEPEPQVFAKLIEGQIALQSGGPQQAIASFREAQALIDTWIGRFLLGQAYLAAEAYTEAYSEFEACLKRRGEATSIFLDDVPSYHYLPSVYYYLGRAQEGLGSPGAADSYRTFLALKDTGDGDPLVADARRRLASD
jgi:tetratricopeptide (TPR) repeat protein